LLGLVLDMTIAGKASCSFSTNSNNRFYSVKESKRLSAQITKLRIFQN